MNSVVAFLTAILTANLPPSGVMAATGSEWILVPLGASENSEKQIPRVKPVVTKVRRLIGTTEGRALPLQFVRAGVFSSLLE
jgi:hypothetical protein